MERIKMQQSLNQSQRPKLRLAEIDRLIKARRIVVPPLSRRKLIKMCEEGEFETAGDRPTTLGWLVYEDSFEKWVRALDS